MHRPVLIARQCPLLPGSPGAAGKRPATVATPSASWMLPRATVPFQGTRAPSNKYRRAHGRIASGVLGSRNTRHESRLFIETRLFPPFPPVIKWTELTCRALEPQPYRLPRSWGSRNTRHETRITAFSLPGLDKQSEVCEKLTDGTLGEAPVGPLAECQRSIRCFFWKHQTFLLEKRRRA